MKGKQIAKILVAIYYYSLMDNPIHYDNYIKTI